MDKEKTMLWLSDPIIIAKELQAKYPCITVKVVKSPNIVELKENGSAGSMSLEQVKPAKLIKVKETVINAEIEEARWTVFALKKCYQKCDVY